MATVGVQHPTSQIPGLTVPLNKTDLHVAAQMYNRIPDINRSPAISAGALHDLAQIFVKHNVHRLFGIGLIHSHCTLSRDKVMLSTKLQNSVSGCWNQGTEIAAIDVARVRGHMFKVAENRELVAYKLEEGQVTDHSFDSRTFIRELCNYLTTNGLTEVLGLQVLSGTPADGVEFDFARLALSSSTELKQTMDQSPILPVGHSSSTTPESLPAKGQLRMLKQQEDLTRSL